MIIRPANGWGKIPSSPVSSAARRAQRAFSAERGCPQPQQHALAQRVQTAGTALPSTLDPRPSTLALPSSIAAFTLLEVMIAMAVFFIVVFAVLGIVAQSLGAARALQRPQPDFSILASQVVLSNVLEEGFESGDFGELGDEYKGYTWERQIVEVGSNGLFQVDFAIFPSGGGRNHQIVENMSVLMYKPGGRRRL
jgi:hypothetical protein